MRNFFDRQEHARRKTGQLIALFIISVILIIVCVYFAVTGVYFLTMSSSVELGQKHVLWDTSRFAVIFIITLLVILGGSLYKINEIKGGGYSIAEKLGGRNILRNTNNIEEKRLLNVVEEIAIASGVPVPDVYVLDKERGINAFAAGFGIDDAVICVTGGGLNLLSRDELQGVIAHEFSHILNSDTLINLRLMGWLHGILLISFLGAAVIRGMRYTRGRGSGPIVLLGFVLYALGYSGLFFGKLIKSSVSRQREYLADASAVQFTRNPSGIAGALKKIGGLTFGSTLSHPEASVASHMYFCDGMQESWFALMATHPPLIDRIKRIDPHFDGAFPEIKTLPVKESEAESQTIPESSRVVDASRVITGAAAMAMLQSIGTPMKEHANMARELLAELPEAVRIAANDPSGACVVVYMLLMSRRENVRSIQLKLLGESGSPGIVAEIERLSGHFHDLPQRVRLPLIDLSMPALRTMSASQYSVLKDNVDGLINADRKISFFEYILRHVLIRRLDAHFIEPENKIAQIYSIRGVMRECSVVLSFLARSGHAHEAEAAAAFSHGRKILAEPNMDLVFLAADECGLSKLEEALEKLDLTSPLIKKKLLAAALECLMFDRTITVREAESFRAVVEALGCPVPPWLLYKI